MLVCSTDLEMRPVAQKAFEDVVGVVGLHVVEEARVVLVVDPDGVAAEQEAISDATSARKHEIVEIITQ